MQRTKYRILLGVLALMASLLCSCIMTKYNPSFFTSDKTSNVSEINEDMVYLGGMPIGIYLQTSGVMVIHTGIITGMDGKSYSPSEYKIKSGDYITALDSEPINNKKELITELNRSTEEDVTLTIRRNNENLNIQIHPIKSEEGKNMLGLWVRDDVQGLGTITYVKGHSFAALGHGIHDLDTNQLLEIQTGVLYRTNIRSVSKSKSGTPGSMEGIIVYNSYNEIGTITQNTQTGILGTVDSIDQVLDKQIPVQVGSRDDIELGEASIRCKVSDEVKEYRIKIIRIDDSNHEINKGMTIEITDPELLELTGGIVQGMSGSPIIQNGKLIGAVTHVLIQDSTKGYGIFIENMMQNEKESHFVESS